MSKRLEAKLSRIRSGERPRALDVFSGCGGMTLGFDAAGCLSVGGVELDRDAARTYALNFHHSDQEEFERHAVVRDITQTDPLDMLALQDGPKGSRGVDILIGGPPCPAFTRVGRAKLRDVARKENAFLVDPRAGLYREYLRFVGALQPLALVMENVPEVLNWGGQNLGDVISRRLEELGYECRYGLLNAAFYGVPQTRERFFLVGIRKELAVVPTLPAPSHLAVLPPGYTGTRNHAFKLLRSSKGEPSRWFLETPPPARRLPDATTVNDAIGDLPAVTGHLKQLRRRAAQSEFSFEKVPTSAFAKLMWTWPGLGPRTAIENHVTRQLTERDYRLFRDMPPGADYPAAHALAVSLFEKELRRLRRRGEAPVEGTSVFVELRKRYVPPYDPSKFPNKWRKLEGDQPSRTLMAHLSKDTYSHIHPSDEQARTITVREAARLQSFPDTFRFVGGMNSSFRQVGNSVPPLMAWALADNLLRQLGARIQRAFPRPKRTGGASSRPDARVA